MVSESNRKEDTMSPRNSCEDRIYVRQNRQERNIVKVQPLCFFLCAHKFPVVDFGHKPLVESASG